MVPSILEPPSVLCRSNRDVRAKLKLFNISLVLDKHEAPSVGKQNGINCLSRGNIKFDNQSLISTYQEEVKPEVNLQSSYLGCGNINVEVNDCMAVLETDLSGFLSITASFISFEITAGLYIGISGHASLDFYQNRRLTFPYQPVHTSR